MITPGSLGDWALFAGMLGSLSAFAVCGHRWVLRETMAPERIRSHQPCQRPPVWVGFADGRTTHPSMGTAASRANLVDARLGPERT
jgi:hypothetical protein